uniref:NADH dehydrogenase subunit 4L n=1 Tax=Marilia sp. XG-2021 TaxID=2996736 RepID=A0A9E8LP02_9NEOP|nr:NADH dehydrogenase subunit 4L [Marilia sp. XG-2021]
MKIMNLVYIYWNFVVGGLMFSLNWKYFMIMLLMMEFMMLNVFMIMFMYLLVMGFDLYFLMMFLVISVCEGVLGLSLLIYMIRFFGNDYYFIFNLS